MSGAVTDAQDGGDDGIAQDHVAVGLGSSLVDGELAEPTQLLAQDRLQGGDELEVVGHGRGVQADGSGHEAGAVDEHAGEHARVVVVGGGHEMLGHEIGLERVPPAQAPAVESV